VLGSNTVKRGHASSGKAVSTNRTLVPLRARAPQADEHDRWIGSNPVQAVTPGAPVVPKPDRSSSGNPVILPQYLRHRPYPRRTKPVKTTLLRVEHHRNRLRICAVMAVWGLSARSRALVCRP